MCNIKHDTFDGVSKEKSAMLHSLPYAQKVIKDVNRKRTMRQITVILIRIY